MSDLTNYHFEVQIRINGAIPKDRRGNKIPRITFNKEIPTGTLEGYIRGVFEDYEAITPEGGDINVEAYVSNSISNTMMNMASFYGSEYRFVKH